MNNPIRIALVEDDQQLLQGIKKLLQASSTVEVVNAFANGEQFLKWFSAGCADVVLMDIGLPGKSGIECVALAKPVSPSTQFLMWTTFDDDEKIFEALRAGATGYLLKNSPVQTIIDAIADVMNGGSPMSSSIARKVIEAFRPIENILDQYNLTSREREILKWLSKGYRYKEIAAELNISQETVRKHVRNMYEKLHVQSRTEALNKVFPVR